MELNEDIFSKSFKYYQELYDDKNLLATLNDEARYNKNGVFICFDEDVVDSFDLSELSINNFKVMLYDYVDGTILDALNEEVFNYSESITGNYVTGSWFFDDVLDVTKFIEEAKCITDKSQTTFELMETRFFQDKEMLLFVFNVGK